MADDIQFEDLRFPVPWGHVSGRWYGNRKVRPILALHGYMDNLGTWDTLVPHLLTSHVGILCIDWPGHGHSSHLPPGMTYMVIEYTQIVKRIMRQYGWQKVSLMGHSMGGVVSLVYTTIMPHEVDMLIVFDIVAPIVRPLDIFLDRLRSTYEQGLIAEERAQAAALHRVEPPSYTYDQLEEVMVRGTGGSVLPETCKNLLNRNITPSSLYPSKYYFSRDLKAKGNLEVFSDHDIMMEMAPRLSNVPHLVIRGGRSTFIGSWLDDVIAEFRRHNALFELHEVDGTHHINLNNPKECADILRPFIARHRPPTLDSWTMDDDADEQPERGKL